MRELLKKLENINLEDIKKIESGDRQFIAIKNICGKIPDSYFLALVITNALIAYQLSGKGEEYWQEFSDYVINYDFGDKLDIIKFFSDFLWVCDCNKRLINMKKIRLNKIASFIEKIYGKEKYYYENLVELQGFLSKNLKQNKEAKTIVFAVKMFGYAARNIWGFKPFDYTISIPIDSRLEKIYKKYNIKKTNIEDFYKKLSKQTKISPLHLDSFLWVNYDKLINTDEK